MLPCPACISLPPYCDACLNMRVEWHYGSAHVRGGRWAISVGARVGLDREWPDYDKCRAIVERIVVELASGDVRLLDQLARACWDGAAKEWRRLKDDPVYAAGRFAQWRRETKNK